MNYRRRLRISGFITLLLEIIGALTVWLGGHYLLLHVFGFLLFVVPAISDDPLAPLSLSLKKGVKYFTCS